MSSAQSKPKSSLIEADLPQRGDWHDRQVSRAPIRQEESPESQGLWALFVMLGGEAGIRTRGGGVNHLNGLASRRDQPLCHLSACESGGSCKSSTIVVFSAKKASPTMGSRRDRAREPFLRATFRLFFCGGGSAARRRAAESMGRGYDSRCRRLLRASYDQGYLISYDQGYLISTIRPPCREDSSAYNPGSVIFIASRRSRAQVSPRIAARKSVSMA